MTDCVVTSHAGTEDGEPCLQRGAHGGDCPGDACEGCAPTPAAPKKLTCTRHEDGVRDALQALPDLYAALGEPTSQNAGTSDASEATQDAMPQPLPPVVAARSLIKATLVTWCKVLEDDFGVALPDERNIANDTRYAILTRQWDVDLAVKAMRAARKAEDRGHFAKVAESHRRAAALLRDERAAGVDVIRALAGHVDDHRPKLLADEPPPNLWDRADDRAYSLVNEGAAHEPHCWWAECWCHGRNDARLPDPPDEAKLALLAGQHRDCGRIFAEDILDVHARARGLAYPRRTALRIRCSCGSRVAVDTDPERYYTCPGCGEYGTLDYWKRREAPPMTSEPMPLAELPEWLLRHHGIFVTWDQLRGWARGERAIISALPPQPGETAGQGRRRLYDPVAVLAVIRHRQRRKLVPGARRTG